MSMEFMPMRSLSQEMPAVISSLERDGELIITNKGKPKILMIDLSNGRDMFDLVTNYRKVYKTETQSRSTRQLAAFNKFVSALNSIDDEPIDSEFDAILNNRVNIDRELDL